MQAPSSQRARRSRSASAGFLLTETLATFAISAFVLLGLVSASSVLLHAVDRSVSHVQDIDDLGRTIGAIAREVSGLTRARWNGSEPQAFVFRGGPNSLFFATARRNTDGTRDTSVVALREIVSAGGTRLMRGEARLSALATGFGDLRFGPQRELGTGPARLRFYYVAADGNAQRPRQNDWHQERLLPAAVIVEAVDRETGRLLVSMRVPIHANADIGCLPKGKGPDKTAVTSPEAAAGNSAAVGSPTQAPTNAVTAAPTPAVAGAADAQSYKGKIGFCGRVDKDQAQANDRDVAGSPPPSSTEPTP